MIDIDPKVRIISTLRTGSVYYFEDEKSSSKEPHYFIVLNERPKEDKVLFLVCTSSQIEKRKNAIKRLGFAEETLIIVSPSECPCFTKDTAIDCNTILNRTLDLVIEKLRQGKLKICTEEIPLDILNRLIDGAMKSNQVSNDIKKYIQREPN